MSKLCIINLYANENTIYCFCPGYDDRVVPAHSFKFAARLQECQAGNAPVLIRIDSKAGHGGGKPLSKVMEETADIYGFIMYNMGMKMK